MATGPTRSEEESEQEKELKVAQAELDSLKERCHLHVYIFAAFAFQCRRNFFFFLFGKQMRGSRHCISDATRKNVWSTSSGETSCSNPTSRERENSLRSASARQGLILRAENGKHKEEFLQILIAGLIEVAREMPQNGKKGGFATGKRAAPESSREHLIQERESLPVRKSKTDIIERMRNNASLVIIGETGSGKTTQVPQIAHEEGEAQGGAIAITQPRRVAAVSVAQRVAQEMGTQVGERVGYAIRFEDRTSQRTAIKFATDGMLLREAMLDENLDRYKVVIVDEAHERTAQTDVLLGLLRRVQLRREGSSNPLKILVMSATLDHVAFTDFFGGSPCLRIPGRLFPVQVLYTQVRILVANGMGVFYRAPLPLPQCRSLRKITWTRQSLLRCKCTWMSPWATSLSS